MAIEPTFYNKERFMRVKKIAVTNRSLPAKGEGLNNVVEGFLSGEGIQQDRESSENCIMGFVNTIASSPRFTVVRPAGLDLRGTGTKAWPVPLDWTEVEKICKENNADALITLETFDSDNQHRSAVRKVTRKIDGVDKEVDEFTEFLDVYVDAGWRVYDPKTKAVIDQSTFRDMKGFDAHDWTPDGARRKLPHQRAATNEAGLFAGTRYAARISPVWVKVSRTYYIKGHDDFKLAKNKVRTSDWEGAMTLWEKHTGDSDEKIAGYACYNMALGCEVNGKLSDALNWAKKSYEIYPKSSSRAYINVITQRQVDAKRLDEQLKE